MGVINCVRTTVIGSMTVRIDNAVKYKCHTLGTATHIIETGPMTVRIGNAPKYKCSTLSSAVHIAVELYMYVCLQSRMYKNNAPDGRDILSAPRIISKC